MKNFLNTLLLALLLMPVMAQEKIILDTDPSFDPDSLRLEWQVIFLALQ